MKIDSPDLKHHLIAVIACGIIAVVELGLRTDWFALAMTLFLIVLASRTAQILWASVLLVELGLLLFFTDTQLLRSVEGDFLVMRVLFLTVLAACESLFATHTLVRNLRLRVEATLPSIWLGFASACLIICVGLVVFDIERWFPYASWAVFFFVLAWRCPKPVRSDKSSWRDVAINGSVLLVTVLLCMIFVEVGLRLFASPPAYTISVGRLIFRAHETAGFAYIENTSHTDKTPEFEIEYSISSQGLRDRVYGKKEEGVFRIVCLGDSFTMGHGVHNEDSYPKVLERVLRERYPKLTIEVVNLGTPIYGLWQSTIKFREIGLDLEPDLLVMQVLPENDVRDGLRREGIVLRSYDPGYQNFMDDLKVLQRRMASNRLRNLSRTYDLLLYAFQPNYEHVLSMFRPQFGADRHKARVVRRPEMEPRPWFMEALLRESYPELDLGYRLLEQEMVELVELCEDKGIELVVLHIPAASSADFEGTAKWLDEQGIGASIYDFRKTSRWIEQVCSAHGWPLVNTMERFAQRVETQSDLMYAHYGHPTANGHELVAASLGEYLDAAYFRTGTESDNLLPRPVGDPE